MTHVLCDIKSSLFAAKSGLDECTHKEYVQPCKGGMPFTYRNKDLKVVNIVMVASKGHFSIKMQVLLQFGS